MYKGQPHVRDPEDAPQPQPLPGALVAFSINGVPQGVAYRCGEERASRTALVPRIFRRP